MSRKPQILCENGKNVKNKQRNLHRTAHEIMVRSLGDICINMKDCKNELLQFTVGNSDLQSFIRALTQKDGEKGEKRTARPYLPNGVIRDGIFGAWGWG